MMTITNVQTGVMMNGKQMKEIKKMVTGYKTRDIAPIFQNVKFQFDSEGLTVTVIHLNYELTKYIDVVTTGSGSFLVPLDTIKKLKNIKNNDVFAFNIIDTNKIELTQNGMKKIIATDNVENFPVENNDPFEYVSGVKYDDILKLNKALLSVAKTETRPILQHVLVRNGHIYSTDSHRLFGTETNIKHDNDIIITNDGIKYLKFMFDKKMVISVFINDEFIKFENTDNKVLLKLYNDGKYPELSRLIPNNDNTNFTVDKKTLYNIVENATTIVKDYKNCVIKFEINTSDNTLTVKSINYDDGSIFENKVNLDMTNGENLTISFNGQYLLDGLKQVESDRVYLRFIGNIRPFTIQNINSENELALILPVRRF